MTRNTVSHRAAAHTEKEVSAYFTSVQIMFFGRVVPGKRERSDASERKYILDLQVSAYGLLATLLHAGISMDASVKTVNVQLTRAQIMPFNFAQVRQRDQLLTTSICCQSDTKNLRRKCICDIAYSNCFKILIYIVPRFLYLPYQQSFFQS